MALAVPLCAQTSLPVTIQSSCSGSTTHYTQWALPTSPTSNLMPLADFGAAGSTACDADVLFSHGAFWRVLGDSGLAQFYDTGAPNDQGGITVTNTVDSWTVRWPDVGNRGVLDATWRIDVECCGRRCGRARHTWTLRNLQSTPLGLEFYAYSDIDYGGTLINETTTDSTGSQHIVRELPASGSCPGLAEFSGAGIATWQVDVFTVLENNLFAPNFAGLTQGTLPLIGGDYAGALGWAPLLPAGGSVTIDFAHGHNCLRCAVPSLVTNYGAAFGPLTLTTNDKPSVGCELQLDATGPASANGTLLLGGRTQLPLPGCPQSLYVDPVLVAIPAMFDASGALSVTLPRTASTVFCGVPIAFQMFALTNGVPCVPLEHSDGLELRFGN